MKLTRRDFIKSIAALMAGFVWSGVRVEKSETGQPERLFGLPIAEVESEEKWDGEIVLGDLSDYIVELPTKRWGYFRVSSELFEKKQSMNRIYTALELSNIRESLFEDWTGETVFVKGISPLFDPIPSGVCADIPQYEITVHNEYDSNSGSVTKRTIEAIRIAEATTITATLNNPSITRCMDNPPRITSEEIQKRIDKLAKG